MADSPFVILYYVPRTPVITSYLYYYDVVPTSGPLPNQPETQPHFLARFTQPTFTRFLYNLAAQDTSVSPVFETNTHFVPRFKSPYHVVLSSLRSNIAADLSGPVPQTGGNPHFIATAWPVTFTLFGPSRENAADLTLPTDVPPHFIGRFTQPVLRPWTGLYKARAVETGPLPTQPETQPHFLGRFTQLAFSRFRYLTPEDITGTVQPEAQPHFLGRFTPVSFARFNYNLTPNDAVPEAQPHFIGRFTQPALARFKYNSAPGDISGPQPETNPHFVGRFTAALFTPFVGLYRNVATDVPAVTQPPANPHFLSRPWPVNTTVFLPFYTSPDITPVIEAQPHFVGRFTRPSFTPWGGLYRAAALDVPLGIQPPANPHFLAKPWPVTFTLFGPSRENAADVAPIADVPPHFVPRFTPVQHYVLRSLRQAPDNQNGPLPVQPETQPHFIGRFTAPTFARFRYNLTPGDTSVAAQPETNVHFIGKFSQPRHSVLPALRGNIAADTSTATPQPSTPIHFIAKPWAVTITVAPPLRQNVPFDAPAQADPHFVGHFTRPAFSRFNYNFTPSDLPPVVQPGGNPHFVGKFSQPRHILLPGLRHTIAADISIQPPANPHTVGKFTPPRHNVPISLRRGEAFDRSGPLPPQPSTEPHFVPRFTQPTMARWSGLYQPRAVDESGPLPIQAETQPHFIGRFSQPAFSIIWPWAMPSATDVLPPPPPPPITQIGCVVMGRACDCGEPHRPLTFYPGGTWEIQGNLHYADGTPFNLGPGCQVMWAMEDAAGTKVLFLTLNNGITVLDAAQGKCLLLIPRAVSLTVPLGSYTDQLRAIDPTGYVSDQWTGPITVAESFFN